MKSQLTPMMQQYQAAKDKHPGVILLFRMGDFYEAFDDDAVLVSKQLQLTLTRRDKQFPMAGFPHHALETHLKTLVQLGHRVAICDQIEGTSNHVANQKREVTRIVTAEGEQGTPITLEQWLKANDKSLFTQRLTYKAALKVAKEALGGGASQKRSSGKPPTSASSGRKGECSPLSRRRVSAESTGKS